MIRPSSPALSLPPPSFTSNSGTNPSESLFNHVSPSILAAAAASASQAGIPPQSLPFLNAQDIPPTVGSTTKDDGEQGEAEKDTKLKEILSHIYQYVSRQYNQRLSEQRETSKRGSPNGLSNKVRDFFFRILYSFSSNNVVLVYVRNMYM